MSKIDKFIHVHVAGIFLHKKHSVLAWIHKGHGADLQKKASWQEEVHVQIFRHTCTEI